MHFGVRIATRNRTAQSLRATARNMGLALSNFPPHDRPNIVINRPIPTHNRPNTASNHTLGAERVIE